MKNFCALRGINSEIIDTAFETFMVVCSKWITEGYRIETPLGTFSPKIKLNSEFIDSSKVKGGDIMVCWHRCDLIQAIS